MKTCLAALIAALVTAGFAATPENTDEVIAVKTGDVVFKALSTDLKTHFGGAPIAFINVDDAKQRQEVLTDEGGACTVHLDAGRYLLEVGGDNVAVVEAAADNTLREVRLLAAHRALVFGGQDEDPKVRIPGAGDEPVPYEVGTLTTEDGTDKVVDVEGVAHKVVDGSAKVIDEGTFVRTDDGRWWRVDGGKAGGGEDGGDKAAGGEDGGGDKAAGGEGAGENGEGGGENGEGGEEVAGGGGEGGGGSGRKRGLILVGAGVVAAVLIAALADDDDDDDDPISDAVDSAADTVTDTLDDLEAAVTTSVSAPAPARAAAPVRAAASASSAAAATTPRVTAPVRRRPPPRIIRTVTPTKPDPVSP